MGKTFTVLLAGVLLMLVCAVPGSAQSLTPQYYLGDYAPSPEVISKSLDRYFGKQASQILIIGVHKVTDNEFLILTGAPDKSGTPPTKTTMYSLWRLESKEWVVQDPTMSTLRYVKVLALDSKDSKP
jgi:hypothetical protein